MLPVELSDEDLVGELLDVEGGLTEWEVEFAESLGAWLSAHPSLTHKQRRKAEQIYRKERDGRE